MTDVSVNKDKYVKIDKDSNVLLVAYSDNWIYAINPRLIPAESGIPFVALAKYGVRTPEARYNEFCRILGKLIQKDVTSKYFGSPHIEEHLTNGRENDEGSVDELVMCVKKTYQQYLDDEVR